MVCSLRKHGDTGLGVARRQSLEGVGAARPEGGGVEGARGAGERDQSAGGGGPLPLVGPPVPEVSGEGSRG